MPPDPSQETPRPPSTREFAPVEVGGAPHDYPSEGSLRVRKLAVGLYENNVFALVSDDEALIVDGADEPDRILALVEGRKVVGIVETHNHPDHVQALPALIEAWGVPVYAHPDDPPPVPFTPLGDGDRLRVGEDAITAIHTPGHTPGSTSRSMHSCSRETPCFPGGRATRPIPCDSPGSWRAWTDCSPRSRTKRASVPGTASTPPSAASALMSRLGEPAAGRRLLPQPDRMTLLRSREGTAWHPRPGR